VTRTQWVLVAAGFALLAVMPFLADKFSVQFASRVLVFALFASSLNLLVGQSGLVSLGHAGFFGVAGYALALASPEYEAAPLWRTLAMAVGVSALLALLIGALVVRTRGIYFLMATLAFGQMLFHLFHDGDFAGGSDGLQIFARPVGTLFGLALFDLEQYRHFHWVVLGTCALVLVFLARLRASPFGRVLEGIRVNEHRMRALGYATVRYKLVAFVIAGTLAGLAGYLSACQFGVVNPESLGWHQSGAVLLMVILGGMGSLLGPALGAAAWWGMELLFQGFTRHWQLPMGAVIVAVALFLPDGLAGLWRRLKPAGVAGSREAGVQAR
jgi:branched-chain amino acid transport system permease protein